MPRHTLNLTDEQKTALCKMRDNGQPAYLRERAAAIKFSSCAFCLDR